MIVETRAFASKFSANVALRYLVFLPQNYDERQDWPLILFLHGRGERGDDPELVKLYGLPKNLAGGQALPFVVVAPQCPANSYWSEEVDALNILLDDVSARYKIDQQRVYLTGMSMGGAGTWLLAARYGQRFAAIAPVCGSGLKWIAEERLQDIPVWVFHGDSDPVVPIARSQEMVDALRQRGENVRFTIYPGVGHDAWTPAYNEPELYDWFLSHRLRAGA